MVIGNPYKFSIIANVIKEWNVEGTLFHNGVLLFCIDGELFPKKVVATTLNSEIHPLKEILTNLTVNEELFNMEKGTAFIEMYNSTFPEWDKDNDVSNDYRYYISTQTLGNFHCCVFAVSDGEQIRIMAAKLDYVIEESRHDLNNMKISETIITNSELMEIILGLDMV